jgi:AcrR family transcriptional regulator
MSSIDELPAPLELVAAAIRAAEQCGRDVADVPLATIAQAAGVSRSTLLRRLGGSRRTLDEAVRATGVDPGGRPVRVRAVEAGAGLVSERGPATVTLEAVAEAAGCSVPSLYAVFGTRDELFAAIYEQYSPRADLVSVCADPAADLEQTVADFYGTTAASLTREPRVATAMLADLLGDPSGPTARIFARYFPQALSSVGGWLQAQVRAGRIRDIPLPLLLQQLMGPLLAHVLMQPLISQGAEDAADLEQVCSVFTSAFLRAVAVATPRKPDHDSEGE